MGKTYISSYNELDCLRGIAHKLGGNAAGANEIGALRTIVTQLAAAPGNRTVGNMNEVDCLRAIVRHYASAGPSFDVDTTDWADVRVPANGGTVSPATKAAVDAYIVGTKADGDWDLIVRGNLLCGDQLAAMQVPFKVGDGSAVETLVNIVAGDYSEATGWTGNGTNKYFNTELLANALTANDTHFAVYNRSSIIAQGGACGVSGSGATIQFGFYPPYTDGKVYSDQYNTTTGSLNSGSAISTPFGFLMASRTSATAHALYRNGSSIASNATGGGTLPALAIYIGARNNNGTAVNFMASPIAGYLIGKGPSAAAAARMNARMQTFQTALGRNV